MFKNLLKKLAFFLVIGFVWLFLFSIPFKQEKLLFNILHFYIVDTKPVHWIIEKITASAKTTEDTAKDKANSFIDKIDSEMKK